MAEPEHARRNLGRGARQAARYARLPAQWVRWAGQPVTGETDERALVSAIETFERLAAA